MPDTQDRWDRLANTLTEAGVTAEVDRAVWHGEIVSSISIRVGNALIHIRDTWWRDHWAGWQVTAENAESIIIRTYPKAKNRGQVRRHVEDARDACTALTTR